MSMPKIVSPVFHLANRCAKRELNISLNDMRLNFDPTPKYLGVTFDRSLTFHKHVKATANTTQVRGSLLKKLAGTGWGTIFTTLRTLTLALAFSTAEYASPSWIHSSHVHKVDTALSGRPIPQAQLRQIWPRNMIWITILCLPYLDLRVGPRTANIRGECRAKRGTYKTGALALLP